MEKEEYALEVLNAMLNSLPQPITYGEFNKVFPVGANKFILEENESRYKELGIARFGTSLEGISIMSIMATLTDCLIGKRLAIEIDIVSEDYEILKNAKIIKFKWVN
jgi:hypothetical protein